MTEEEFLALPVGEQNALTAPHCGYVLTADPYGGRWVGHGKSVAPDDFALVNGDGNAFFGMWDALPREGDHNGDYKWRLCESSFEGMVFYSVERETECEYCPDCGDMMWWAGGDAPTPNLAAALALLKARGVIEG